MITQKTIRNSMLLFLLVVGCSLAFNFKVNTLFYKKQAQKSVKHQDGDIVFQINPSGQGKAIQLATHSKYTHCGVVFIENGQSIVYEAVQPVKKHRFRNGLLMEKPISTKQKE